VRLPPDSLERWPVLRLAADALAEHDPWLVGGSVRDLFLGRPLEDVDLIVAGDPRAAARALAEAGPGHAFELSDRFGAWRVIASDRSWQSDLTAVREGSIEAGEGSVRREEPAQLVEAALGRDLP